MSLVELKVQAEEIANLMRNWDDVISIAYVPNADSLIAASIFAKTFYSLEKPCVLFSLSHNEDTGHLHKRNKNHNSIIIGVSPAEFDFPAAENSFIFVNTEPADTLVNVAEEISYVNLNSSDYGYAGIESSLSAVSTLICLQLNPDLIEVLELALVASHTKNPLSKYVGLTDHLAQKAQTMGLIRIEKRISILGSEIMSIADSFTFSFQPFLPGLTGNELGVREFFARTGVEIEIGERTRKLKDLDREEVTQLNTSLIIHLSTQKGHLEEELVFIRDKTFILREKNDLIVSNTWDYAVSINDAILRNEQPLALAVLIGNRSEYLMELGKLYSNERKSIMISYQFLTDHLDEVVELKNLRYFVGDSKILWYNSMLTAAMALSSGSISSDLLFAVVAPGPDSNVTVGLRASKGLNLPKGLIDLVKNVAMTFDNISRVEGSKLSSQIIIPKEAYQDFLFDLNKRLE